MAEFSAIMCDTEEEAFTPLTPETNKIMVVESITVITSSRLKSPPPPTLRMPIRGRKRAEKPVEEEAEIKQAIIPSSRTSLLSLPFDLHFAIIKDHLFQSPSTLTSLRSTCSYFRRYITPTVLRRSRRRALKALTKQELAETVIWDGPFGPGGTIYEPFYPLYMNCYSSCLERKPRWNFIEGRQHSDGPYFISAARDRWCKPCGARTGQAQPGVWYFEGGFDENDYQPYGVIETSTVSLRGGLACVICRKSNCPLGLYWGCGDCYRKEKARRRDFELLCMTKGRVLPPATASWVRKKLRDERRPAAIAEPTSPAPATIPRRETRCEACWRFPSRCRNGAPEAVYDALPFHSWCDPCQALRHTIHRKEHGIDPIPAVTSLREEVVWKSARTMAQQVSGFARARQRH